MTKPWDMVYSDNRLTQGLAKLSQTPYKFITEEINFAKVFTKTNDNKILIVIEAFNKALQQEIAPGLMHQLLNHYEVCLFAPMLAALKAKQLSKVSIYTDAGIYNLTAKQVQPWWHFW